MEPLVLTFDIGTQSARAVLVDDKGNLIHKTQKKFDPPYFSLQPGWAEQDANYYWNTICELSLALKEISGEDWLRICAVSLTTIRDTNVCIDKDGNPIRPVILWLDKREANADKPLPFIKRAAFQAAGMGEAAKHIRRISVCNWLMQNEPENWAKTDKYLMLSGYMHYCLCGKMVDSVANIIGHVPFDSKTRRWMKPSELSYCLFPIPREKLCDLCDPGTVIGSVTEKASELTGIPAGTPLVATGSDKGCETIGLGCVKPGQAALSFGTTATIQYTTSTFVEPQQFMPAYVAAIDSHWNPEIEIFRGYWLISWFTREFAAKELQEASEKGVSPEQLLNERLREIPPGCDGLMMQPYFTPGVKMPTARGSVIGFSDVTTRIHIYRSIIEGINFALINGMKSIEKRMKTATTGVYLAGGGSQSAEICQITADMFGVPAYRTQTHEAAVIGSSMIAFTSMGHFKDIYAAMDSMVHIRDTFMPNMEANRHYNWLYSNVFTKTYKRLKPLYDKSYKR